MKYNVITLIDNTGGSSPDATNGFTFYTLNSAIQFTTEWVALSAAHYAYLWDGIGWRFYS